MRNYPSSRSPSAIALLLLSMVLLGGHEVAIGQVKSDPPADAESTPEEQVTDETPGAESEPEKPGSPSGEKPRRRIFKRIGPQPLTPEEREESERLRKTAAKYGTDPTAIVGRFQLSSQYLDLASHTNATVSTVRVDLPFRGDFLLRTDVPFLRTTEAVGPETSTQRGLSDVSVTAGWRVYNTPEYAVLIGMFSTFPTASEPTLGFGKYTLGPVIATARFLPRLDSLLFGVLNYTTSIGGDPSRKDVSFFSAAAQINSFWGQHWWTIVQSIWQVDFERSAKSSMTMEFEGGRNLIGRFGAYVRPGVGIYGRDLTGAYIWNIEVGVRYVFKSF